MATPISSRNRWISYTSFLVVGMLITGTCNTLLNKVQDMQCVDNCDDPDPRKRRYFEQPVYQTLNMFLGELSCLLMVYGAMAVTAYQAWRTRDASFDYSAIPTSAAVAKPSDNIHAKPIDNYDTEEDSDEQSEQGTSQREKKRPIRRIYDATKHIDDTADELHGKVDRLSGKAQGKTDRARKQLHEKADLIKEATEDLTGKPAETAEELDEITLKREPLEGIRKLWFWLPTLCDICGTTLMNVGLIYTTASVYQMLRGAVVIFSGIFSIFFLNYRMYGYQWFSLIAVVAGVSIVGSSSIFGEAEDSKGDMNPQNNSVAIDDTTRAIIGVAMVLFAQIFTAAQFVIEEKIMEKYEVEPLTAVGLEGFFGFFTVLFSMPILHFFIGRTHPGGFFDIPTGWHQIWDNQGVWLSGISIACSIALFNWFGLSVTRTISATSRATIDTCRTLFIWLVSLSLGWETFRKLQVVGFAVLVYGTFLYNGVIDPPKSLRVRRRRDSIVETEPLVRDN